MPESQRALDDSLPPLAEAAQIIQIEAACNLDKARMGPSAKAHLALWRIHESELRGAILQHIRTKRRIYLKYEKESDELLPGHLQANITLHIGRTVYVEMVLMDRGMIIVHAHEHTTTFRLPQ